MQQTSFSFDRHLRAQIGALQGRFKSGTEPGTIKNGHGKRMHISISA